MSYIGNTTQNQSFVPVVDFFSGNGSTTAFTLSHAVGSVYELEVVVNNVQQNPSSAYTVSGSTITFTSAPSSGSNNIYVYYVSPNTQVVQPGQGTVYPSSLSTGGPYWSTAGYVGIGTTSPQYQLDILTGAGGAYAAQFRNGTSTQGLRIVTGMDSVGPGLTDDAGNRLIQFDQSAKAQYFWTNGAERMRINSAGNVGIAVTDPASTLDVKGGSTTQRAYLASAIRTRRGASNQYGGYSIAGSVVADGFMGMFPSSDDIVFGHDDGSLLREEMRLQNGGSLCIGTASNLASAKLTTYWASNNPGISVWNAAGTSGYYNLVYFYNNAGNSLIGSITRTNDASTNYNTTSDYRLKENVQPMQNAMARVQQLKPVTYTWKSDGSDGEGFIAHELQEVVPFAVTGDKDAVDADGKPVYQGVDTSHVVAVLVAAIQELKAELDELKAKVGA